MIKRQHFMAAIAAGVILLLMSCGSHQQTSSQEAAQAQQPAQANQAAPPSGNNAPRAASERPREAKKEEPRVQTYTVSEGTPVHIRLNDTISTATATTGTPFEGTLSSPLVAGGVVVAPAGSAVAGQITGAERGGRLHHPAALSLALTSLTPTGGSRVAISTNVWSEQAKSQKKRDAIAIGGGAGLGALIGAVAGKGKGAAIGAAAGAGAGTAGAAFTGQKQIVLKPETPLRFVLNQPVTLTRSKP